MFEYKRVLIPRDIHIFYWCQLILSKCFYVRSYPGGCVSIDQLLLKLVDKDFPTWILIGLQKTTSPSEAMVRVRDKDYRPFLDIEHRGPCTPYKPCNHNLYIGIIIFFHIDAM